MKRFFSLVSICLISLLFLAGCGIEGGTVPTGIEFVDDVFYVDYNVETFLDYKTYPSTAQNIYVSYGIEADQNQDTFYEFSNGSIKVTDKRFTSITVTARLTNYSDSCEVRLKEYPTSVFLAEESVTLDAGLIYSLNLQGEFLSGIRNCENAEFNYKVISSNPSVVKVISEDNLLVQSTGRRGSATITVKVCNSKGEEVESLTDTLTINVIEAVDSSYASFGNLFVFEDGGTTEATLVLDDQFKISVKYFDPEGFLIENASFECYLSNDNVFEKVVVEGEVYLKVKGEGTVTVTLMSDATDAVGSPVRIQHVIVVQFS